MRTLLHRVPWPPPSSGCIRVWPQCKALVMFRSENYVFRSGALEDVRPMCGIVELGAELRGEIGVGVIGAIKSLVHFPASRVNRSGIRLLPLGDGVPIPFGIGKLPRDHRRVGGNGIDSPVNKDAELGVGKPRRDGALVE